MEMGFSKDFGMYAILILIGSVTVNPLIQIAMEKWMANNKQSSAAFYMNRRY